MNESKISIRYSRALFQAALDKNLVDKISHDMRLILEISRLPDVKEFLGSPIIVPSKKTRILHEILGREIQKLTLSLIDLTVKNGREAYIPAIARDFIQETMKYNGISETSLTTAVKVGQEIKDQIASIAADLFKTKIELHDEVDGNIIGGFILKVGDNYIDASIKNKLRKIKKEFNVTSIIAD